MEAFNNIVEWADKFTIIVSIITLIFAGRNWWNNRKLNQQLNQNITITLKHPPTGAEHCLNQTVKRRYASRAEIQGLLANAYAEEGRYNLPYLSTSEYAEQIEAIQDGRRDNLNIMIEDEKEYQKFL